MITIKREFNYNSIKEIWGQLFSNNSNTSIYQSPEYNEIIWNNLILYKIILRINPVFYVFYESENPILIVPLFKSLFNNSYTIYGNKAGCGYLDFIYGDFMNVEMLSECLIHLKREYGVSRIFLNHIRSHTILAEYAKTKNHTISDTLCTAIAVPNEYDEYYSSLSKNTRQNIRTAYNRLAKDDMKLNFSFVDYSILTKEKKRELLNIYIKRQMTKYHKLSFVYKVFAKYIDIGTKIENIDGFEAAAVLSINGDIAAFFDALYGKDTIIVPRLSIDSRFDRYSPGVLLINESVKWLIENSKFRKIDLTHGNEKYKLSMGGEEFKCIDGEINI